MNRPTPAAGAPVFLDANVLIESFRIGVWAELSAGCWLETVQTCETESLTGDTSRPGHVAVDAQMLRAGLRAVHPVTRAQRNALVAQHRGMTSLDDGELELFAYLHDLRGRMPALLVISTADKGAIVRTHDLGWLDRLISLEQLLTRVGAAKPKLAAIGRQHRTGFLDDVRRKVRLGIIP